MPCLLVVLALATPRLVIAVLWFFTTWFKGLFDTPLWPIVGLVVALMIDVSPAGGRRSKKD